MPTMSAAVNVDTVLDQQRISPAHVGILILLFLALMVDGYDILVVGYALPPIAHSLHVHPEALTGVFVAQQFGLLLGALIVGPLADRFGRRTLLLTCIGISTVATLLTTQAATVTELMIARFVSAIFFSAIIPSCIALASEVAPKRIKAGLVATVFSGYTAGVFIAAFFQAFVLEAYGWQGAFWLGGMLGAVVFVILLPLLPESIRYRAQRDPGDPRIGKALSRFDRNLKFSGTERFVLDGATDKKPNAPVLELFRKGLITPTLLLWTTYIGIFTVSHLSGAWNTTVLHDLGGLSFKYLASMAALATVAGIIATISSGFIIDKFGPARTMPVFFIAGAASLTGYALINLHTPMFYVVGTLTAFFINCGLGSVNVLGALLYPSRIRATGVSWATGAGRLGGMIGPIAGGLMLAQHWGLATIYLVEGTPLFVAALATLLIGRWVPSRGRREAAEAALIAPAPFELVSFPASLGPRKE
jgi:MFS transporter, AAHS family, 4-hydroxybenzoate transporter